MQIKKLNHDEFFKTMISRKEVAIEFFSSYLTKEELSIIDLNSLKLQDNSFIEENLKKSCSDILYKACINNHEGYLYLLIEHQSRIDLDMPYRLHKYMINIIDKYRANSSKKKDYPSIIPIVFYNGERRYNGKLNFFDLFQNSNLAKKYFTEDFKLIDLNLIPDDELRKKKLLGAMEFLMKKIREKDLLQNLRETINIYSKGNYSIERINLDIMPILCYAIVKINQEDREELKLVLDQNFKEKSEEIMGNLADAWEMQGRQKGIQEGKIQGIEEGKLEERYNMVKNMFLQNLDSDLIASCTGLGIKEIEEIKNNIKK